MKPPDIGMLRDKTNLQMYIHAQNQWARLSGTPRKQQADLIMWHASNTFPALYKEMVEHFGNELVDAPDGLNKVTAFLKDRFGLDNTADLINTFKTYMGVSRKKGQDLASYTREVEHAYSQLNKMGENLSYNFQSLFLLDRANLSVTDYQIATASLKFNDEENKADKKIYTETKEALKKMQNSSAAVKKSENKPDISTLLAYLDDDDSDPDLALDDIDMDSEDIKTFIAKVKGKFNKKGSDKSGKIWKCSLCICDCVPKWKPCEHECSKHKYWQCPKYDPKKDKKIKNKREEEKRKNVNFEDNLQTKKPKQNSYLTFAKNFENTTRRDSDDQEGTFIVRKEERLQQYQPLSNLLQALEDQEGPELHSEDTDVQGGPLLMICKSVQAPATVVEGDLRPDLAPELHSEDTDLQGEGLVHEGPLLMICKSVQAPAEVVEGDQRPDLAPNPNQTRPSCIRDTTDVSPGCQKIFFQDEEQLEEVESFKMLIDTGSPSTIVSIDKFKEIKNSFPKVIQNQLSFEESNKQFQFGGGRKTLSMGQVKLPVWIKDQEEDLHVVFVWVDVVQQKGVPLLLGSNSLIKVKAQLDLATMTMNFKLKKRVRKFPIHQVESGHIMLPFYPLTEADDTLAWSRYLQEKEWTDTQTQQVIHYVVQTKNPDREAILQEEVFVTNISSQAPLREKQVNKLHHFFGHVNAEHLRKLIRRADRYDEETKKAVDNLKNCEVCKLEANRVPRPKTAMPRAVNFNHLICVDLKENKRYPAAGSYIVYIIDAFTKFKIGKFIKNKSGDTVTNAIYTEWIKLFGPPSFIQTDRGREFLCKELKEMCKLHDINFLTTPSYSASSNGLIERGHFTVDKMIHRMITADPKITPQAALAFSLHAANTLFLTKEGITPHTLVFGRNPVHPSLHDFHPGNDDQDSPQQSQFYKQFKTMISAREAYVALEADRSLQEALQSRVFANAATVQRGDWIYFKRNIDRKWQGPVKVVLREGKRLHCVNHGQNTVVNLDDVLLHKPDNEFNLQGEEYVTIPLEHGDELENRGRGQTNSPEPSAPDYATPPAGEHHLEGDDRQEGERGGHHGGHLEEDNLQHQEERETRENAQPVEELTENESPSHSTAPDIGVPMVCNLCQEEVSSRLILSHCETVHNVQNKNIRSIAKIAQAQPDSLYQNLENLKPGVALAQPNQGKYFVLQQKNGNVWRAEDLSTRKTVNLDLLNDMSAMRFVGEFEREEEDGVVVNNHNQEVFLSKDAYTQKIFFTSENNYEPEPCFVVTIPKSQHHTLECRQAKEKELSDFETFDVYEEVDAAQVESDNIIGTQWVLVRKEMPDGSTKVKGRLCMMGNLEKNKSKIPTDSPTINKMTLKIFITIAASMGWEFISTDVRRAFLQTEELDREVYCIPPSEANVPPGKLWRIVRSCYGFLDASRAFYLRYVRELKDLGYQPLRLDPAGLYHKTGGKLDATYAIHVDDAAVTGKEDIIMNTHKEMERRIEHGEVQKLPYRFLGMNYKKLPNGDIQIDQDHYFKELEIPDISGLSGMVKVDVLSEKWQTTFRSLASKLNLISLSSRPDIVFQAKYLTTRYGKATKSDMTTAVKLVRHIKEESSAHVIPNLGSNTKDWILVGCSDASNRSQLSVHGTGGQVIMIVNRVTGRAAVINWSSRKLSRVVHSSMGAETLSLQKLTSQLFFVRQILLELFGDTDGNIPTLALTDCHDLYSAVHHIKSCTDARLAADVTSIREAIHLDRTITELRFCHGSEMVADSLTKYKKLGQALWDVVRTGTYSIPGGVRLRDSTKTAIRTWAQLLEAENQEKTSEVE